MLLVLFFFSRLNWPELIDHPFWTQVKKEEDDAKEGDENNKRSDKGERNGCEGDDSVSLRCVDAFCF